MARGGKRTYTRDANGRFASTPGGGLGSARKAARPRSGRTSTLGARTSLKKSRAKLASKDPADQRLSTALSTRAQKGAVTRGNKGLKAAKAAARTRIDGGMKGGIARSRSAKSQLTGAKPAAPVLRDSSRAKGSRTRLPRVGGVVAKPKGLKPGAPNKAIQAFRPGQFKRLKTMQGVSYGKLAEKQARLSNNFRPDEFYRGNFRPRNVTAKPVKDQNPFLLGKGNTRYKTSSSNDDKAARLKNVETARKLFESKGLKVTLKSNKNSTSVASYNPVTKDININRSHSYWINPASAAKHSRAKGDFSSSSPTHVVYHELGHAKDKMISTRIGPFGNMWILATRQGATQDQRVQRATKMEEVARRVSKYATTSPSEFIAEAYAGRRTGRKYDYQVMDAYREAAGLSPLSLRKQKPIRRKPKP